MRIQNTCLIAAIAGFSWVIAGMGNPVVIVSSGSTESSPLAIQGSAYGSLLARLMKDSMHNYWHAGREDVGGHGEHEEGHSHGEPHEHGSAGTSLHHTEHTNETWLEHWTERLTELEEEKRTPTANFKISAAHHRYLEATASWQLRVAYQLDPGDSALYEIMHYTTMARASSPEHAHRAAVQLAERTVQHGLAPTSGLADALTGAGAVINLLNNELQVGGLSRGPDPAAVRQNWEQLLKCLERYQELRAEAERQGWWQQIPEVRRKEMSSYAALVQKLSRSIGRKIAVMENPASQPLDGSL